MSGKKKREKLQDPRRINRCCQRAGRFHLYTPAALLKVAFVRTDSQTTKGQTERKCIKTFLGTSHADAPSTLNKTRIFSELTCSRRTRGEQRFGVRKKAVPHQHARTRTRGRHRLRFEKTTITVERTFAVELQPLLHRRDSTKHRKPGEKKSEGCSRGGERFNYWVFFLTHMDVYSYCGSTPSPDGA